jgi:hypothetical protein
MTERRQGWAVWTIAAVAVALIGTGLVFSGGPMQGRAERRDAVRMHDLNAAQTQAICRAFEAGAATANLAPTAACPETLRLTDPFTDRPYRIEMVDADNLRFCAVFERPDHATAYRNLTDGAEPGESCLIHRLPQDLDRGTGG